MINLLSSIAKAPASKVALIDSLGTHTYGRLTNAACQMARVFTRNERVALLTQPDFTMASLMLGTWKSKACCLPLDAKMESKELAECLRNVDLIVAHLDYMERVGEIGGQIEHLPFLPVTGESILKLAENEDENKSRADDGDAGGEDYALLIWRNGVMHAYTYQQLSDWLTKFDGPSTNKGVARPSF